MIVMKKMLNDRGEKNENRDEFFERKNKTQILDQIETKQDDYLCRMV